MWCLADMAGRRLFADGEIILEVHKLKKRETIVPLQKCERE